jgi:hypothetical protein
MCTVCCHRDIGALFDYPNWGFSVFFFSVVRQKLGYNSQRRGTARISRMFLIVIYVPFSVLCVLFVCKCVLDCCHRDIGVIFDYHNWGFSVRFPKLWGKLQGITRKDRARLALPKFFFLLLCMFRSLYSVYCLCVNVFCTAATRCQPNCSYK